MKNVGRSYVGKSILHRSAITAVDKLATPGTPVLADFATGGSLVFSTNYKVAVAAANNVGPTIPSTVANVTTAADAASTHAIDVTIAQVASALFYDIFLSTAAAPLWVARVTEARRAAGVTVTAVGTISATSPGAGVVRVNVVGTGVATTAAPFAVSNAFITDNVTGIDCTGFNTATLYVSVATDDLRSLPTFSYTAFRAPVNNPTLLCSTASLALSPLSAARTPLRQVGTVTVNGTGMLFVLADAISGQGTSVDIWVDLN